MPHWKSLMDKPFLGSWDFEKGEIKTVTITGYKKEIMKDPRKPNAEERTRVVLEFAECKKAVMNVTNLSIISDLFGDPDLDHWIGKQIALHVEKVRFGGKMTDGIRVMEELPAAQKYFCADCNKEIVAVGNWSAKQLADRSAMDFGVCLCVNCAKTRTEAAKNDETDA